METVEKSGNSEFERKIGALSQSPAYLDFCEEVYGCRLALFNMLDKEQLDFILNELPVTRSDSLLDVGCGDGGLLGLLINKYGCSGTGVDLLDGSVIMRRGMRYIRRDIDFMEYDALAPTLTLAVDSLYFSADMEKLLDKLARCKNNRLYLFYSQYVFDATADRAVLKSHNTQLAKALDNLGLAYKTRDYSENERTLYAAMLSALEKHKSAFERENKSDLYEEKLNETLLGAELYKTGRASRYLYIIDESR